MRQNLLCFIVSVVFLSFHSFEQGVTISGVVKDSLTNDVLPFVSIRLKKVQDSAFVMGTISDEKGLYSFNSVGSGSYFLEFSFYGYKTSFEKMFVGSLVEFLDASTTFLTQNTQKVTEVVVVGVQDAIGSKMDKKTFSVDDNIGQAGGSVLQTMQNLPGVTVQDGKVLLRGSDQVTVLIDGKQTAVTGFGNQNGLDNIPASAIERIEIINNPSAKFDANGNAGIINIIYKKDAKNGFNGKVGLVGGLGALWVKKANLPSIRPQNQFTPKLNPSLSFNYRKNKVNWFFQGDYLFNQTLNKNDFVTREYDDGTIINQQTVRNRNTHFTTVKTGIDWQINEKNKMTIAGMFTSEKILDNGDQPFFDGATNERIRLWSFLEDELKTTAMGMASFEHKLQQAGHKLSFGLNYTYHRENEKYFFDNTTSTYTSTDAFKLLSDEHVADFTMDYVKPLKYGRLETGIKFRERLIPTNMQFIPGAQSEIDSNAGGWANYAETIPAIYGNYILESKKYEAEIGLRAEYVNVSYKVNPNHPTYNSSGYNYFQPFPSMRLAYKISDNSKVSFFFNRRVDRPNEVDIRIFPKYDDAELIKVGNPSLRPQFTNSLELGIKQQWKGGYFYGAVYHRFIDGTITRLSSTVDSSILIYAVFQNINNSYNSGIEIVIEQKVAKWYTFNVNGVAYRNQIDAFSVVNYYPKENTVSSDQQVMFSGNLKMNNNFKFNKDWSIQITAIYLAPDIIPQGKIGSRFSLDLGVKKSIQKGKGQLFLNATDLLNTMLTRTTVQGNGFRYSSNNYYETQVVRIGYYYKF